MLFDDNDPKYRLLCCCGAHVRAVSVGVVCFCAFLSIIGKFFTLSPSFFSTAHVVSACAGALHQLATNIYELNDQLPLMLIFVSLLTIGAVVVWALAVRTGRWHLMLVLHIALVSVCRIRAATGDNFSSSAAVRITEWHEFCQQSIFRRYGLSFPSEPPCSLGSPWRTDPIRSCRKYFDWRLVPLITGRRGRRQIHTGS
jgi:hypothetical protein